jgi:iron complex outermembrane receptor protein
VVTGWRIPQGQNSWDISVWAKNITDEHYLLAAWAGTNNNYAASIGTPRTIGATLKYSF